MIGDGERDVGTVRDTGDRPQRPPAPPSVAAKSSLLFPLPPGDAGWWGWIMYAQTNAWEEGRHGSLQAKMAAAAPVPQDPALDARGASVQYPPKGQNWLAAHQYVRCVWGAGNAAAIQWMFDGLGPSFFVE
jgi:hypothetical protein